MCRSATYCRGMVAISSKAFRLALSGRLANSDFGKVIHIDLQLPEGTSQPSKLDLVSAMQNRVRTDRDQSGEARFQGKGSYGRCT